MSVNPEQNYPVAAAIFEGLEWRGDGRRKSNKRYYEGRSDQYATMTDPKDVIKTAFGVYEEELAEADAEQEGIVSLQNSLETNIGKVMLLKSGGWEDGAQKDVRLFSPLPTGQGNVLEFGVRTASYKSGGYRGWATKMEIPAIADVYDIWYQDTDVRPTTIGYPLYKTHRIRGSMALRTEILRPVGEIQLVTDPDEVREITMAEHPGYGDELIEMMQDAIVHLQGNPELA